MSDSYNIPQRYFYLLLTHLEQNKKVLEPGIVSHVAKQLVLISHGYENIRTLGHLVYNAKDERQLLKTAKEIAEGQGYNPDDIHLIHPYNPILHDLDEHNVHVYARRPEMGEPIPDVDLAQEALELLSGKERQSSTPNN